MKLLAILTLLIGLGAVGVFVWTTGPDKIVGDLVEASWWIAVVAAMHLVYMAIITEGWRALLEPHAGDDTPAFRRLFLYRWIADGMQALLPVAEVGGDAVRGYMAKRDGVDGPLSAAVIIVELTLRVVSLVLFIALGIATVSMKGGTGSLTQTLLAGGGLALVLVLFYLAQRKGATVKLGRLLQKHSDSKKWRDFAGSVGDVEPRLEELWKDHRPLLESTAWHFLAWVVGAAEIWVLLRALHEAGGPLAAFGMEAVGQAGRNAGFFIPAGLGAQEGGYYLGARLTGLAGQVGVGIAILKRVRDVILGVPALIVWRVREGSGEESPEGS